MALVIQPYTRTTPKPLIEFSGHVNHHLKLQPSISWRRQPKASWQEVAGVLVFSAIPFTAVKAFANSPFAVTLQKRLLQQKLSAAEESIQRNRLAQLARNRSRWYGGGRPRWLGPIPFEYPSYLTGQLPGDYGFDLAGLGKDPDALLRYYNFEILHARWAMLGALGALIPEILDLSGASHFAEPVWWRVGYSKLMEAPPMLPGHGILAGIPGSIRRDTDPGMKSVPDTPFCSRVRRPLKELKL